MLLCVYLPSIIPLLLLLLVTLTNKTTASWSLLMVPSRSLSHRLNGQQKSIDNRHSIILRASSSSSSSSSSNNAEDSEKRRMQAVRSLQTSFYLTAEQAHLDSNTGILQHLPLWRVPWQELPGRTNVLHVHEAVYTNMFETILHAGPPYYVGHLYLPGSNGSSGSSSSSKHSKQYPLLQPWWNQQQAKQQQQQQQQHMNEDQSAVLGTLLRIADFRRMSDGRLLLLVQALERFVVTHVHQTLPYSIADVQLLPDIEELTQASSLQSYIDAVPESCVAQVDDDDEYWLSASAAAGLTGGASERITQPVRSMSLLESFQRWHRYEFENTMLPLPLETDLCMEQVMGSSLAQVLPYAPYSAVIDVNRLLMEPLPGVQDIMQHCYYHPSSSNDLSSLSYNNNNNQSACTPSLESRLLQAGILQKPSNLRTDLRNLSCDELEIRLWNALNDFLKSSRKAVSPILFGLLPPDYHDWPKQFVLERIANAIGEQTVLDHRYVRVSSLYPAVRRQKRLSFAAAALLEQQVDSCQKLRARLLAMPSTRNRLAFVLQLFLEQVESFQ